MGNAAKAEEMVKVTKENGSGTGAFRSSGFQKR